MGSVQFDENNTDYGFSRNQLQPEYTGLVGLFIKLGIVKDKEQANVVMIVIMICSLAVTAFVIFR